MCSSLVPTEIPIPQELQALGDDGAKTPALFIKEARASGRFFDFVKSEGMLEHTQNMAAHSSPRTTKLYDRRNDETALDEYEKVRI